MRSIKGAIIDKNEAIKEREKNLINESCRILVHSSAAADAIGAVPRRRRRPSRSPCVMNYWIGEFSHRGHCALRRSHYTDDDTLSAVVAGRINHLQ